ncbi:hypothetical protein Q1695_010645 [Nippostrongylus brasiliensis]|nr:hypothetical protein Q1695_010645 [Nippostrongylus brasiliensis]
MARGDLCQLARAAHQGYTATDSSVMNPNESFLSNISTANTGTPAMARIVANVVDMQQHLVSQYETTVNSIEGLKTEVRTATQAIREDLRRTDDRAQKLVDDLRVTHANEVARLMDLIKMLLIKDTNVGAAPAEAPRMTSAQMAYANAAPASSFFGPPAGATLNDLAAQAQAHYTACYIQQLQEQQRMRSAGVQGGFFGNQQPVGMGGLGLQAFPQSQYAAAPVPAPAAAIPKTPVAVSTVPPTSVTAPVLPPITSISASTVGASTPTTTTTATAPMFGTAAPPVSNLFMGGTKPPATVSLPVTSPAQPLKTEVPVLKSEAATQKPTFTFSTTTPAATAVTSEAPKPVSNIFAGIKPTENVFSKTPDSKQAVKKETGGGDADEDDHDHVEEFEPQVDFKPVCPLPELVKVVTGEEDEKVIFEERCKLYRFADDTKEWKERGTGVLKVLENTNNKKCRIVMRREQVHKVCANHQLLPGMTIQMMRRGEKAMMWYCEDFSEEEGSHEKLSARFASVEVANKFKEVFENAVKAAAEGSPMKVKQLEKSKEESAATGDTKPKDSVVKKDEKPTPASTAEPQKGYGDQFKLQAGQWECPECYSRTDADKCPCCGYSKEGGKAAAPATKTTLPASSIPLGGAPSTEGQKFTFGLSAAAAAKDSPVVSASNTPKSSLFGASLISSSGTTPSSGISFGKSSIFGGATSKTTTEGTSTLPQFSFAKKPDATATPTTTSTTSSTPVTFSFKPSGSTPSSVQGSGNSLFGSKLFGTSSTAAEEKKDETSKNGQDSTQKTEQKVFGSGFGGNLTFASLAKSSAASIFDSANTQKAQAEFAAQAKSKLAIVDQKEKSPENKPKGESGDGEKGADEEYEPDVHFAPVVPLPELVDVVTGEEGEEVVFTARAKLFRFVKEAKENKERGVGDLKILRNPKTGAHRVVMRREQVHKVCANFAILPNIELSEKKGMPNVYNWICRDFSESPDGIDEIFTAKFKTAEIAKEFHDKFVDAAKSHPIQKCS